MEIKTCEQYVLAELEYWKARAEAAESDQNALKMLKDIFVVEDDPDTGEVRIGAKNDKLDVRKDRGAMARIVLLKSLFGSPDGTVNLEQLFGGAATVAASPEDIETKNEAQE